MPGSTNEFGRLNYLYNDSSTNTNTGLTTSPLYFVKSGYILDTSIEGQINMKGLYWSSTLKDSVSSYDFAFTQSAVITDDASFKKRGLAMRCVAR